MGAGLAGRPLYHSQDVGLPGAALPETSLSTTESDPG